MNILVGADPELFVFKNGVPVSCHGLIPGTKQAPHVIKDGAVQVDGLAAEFNITPSANAEEFLKNISSVTSQLANMLSGYELRAIPVAHFGEDYIEAQPLEAKELGCEPDYNAWDYGMPNPAPDASKGFRTGAGHVHVGMDGLRGVKATMGLVRSLDGYLGLSSLLWDDDKERRELYGKAGAYRKKPYGVEYRTLSNAWLNSPELIRRVFNLTTEACINFTKGVFPFEKYGEEIREIINTSNTSAAVEILKKEGVYCA